MSILGNRVLRQEDPKFLTTGGTYVDDINLDGCAYVTFVRSTIAHALITGIDVTEARLMPGVIAVYTAAEVDLGPMMPPVRAPMPRPLLATDRVRFVGDLVAAVVSESRAQGVDAAEHVLVDYEPLAPLVDVEAALTDEVLVHPDAGTNVCAQMGSPGRADPGAGPAQPAGKAADGSAVGADDFFDGCEVVVRQRIVNQRVAACPLEVRSALASWGTDGRLTQYGSTQGAHTERDALARAHGLDPSRVHVVSPDVGGGFGAKMETYPEAVLVGWIAGQIGRPAKWTETRSESMVAFGHGRAQLQTAALGGTRDGRLLAYRLDVLQDAGAYPQYGALLPSMTRMMASGVYDIARVEFSSTSVVTTTTPVTAYRGAGRPEATAALERMVDLFATEIGMDPVEVRRRNFVAPAAFPYTNPTGTTYDCGEYARALELAVEVSGYEGLREEQRRRRAAGEVHQLGIGVSTYVEITGAGAGTEFGSVEVLPNGRAVVRTGTSPHGQGHATAWAMLASEHTGIPVEDIDVLHGDTDVVPRGGGTGGSRSLQVGGVAVNQAAGLVVERARERAAEMLEASVDDVVLDRIDGRFHVAGTPAVGRSWPEVAVAAGDGPYGGIAAEVDFAMTATTFPFGAHIAVVDLDMETGKATLERVVAVDDAGRILNPLIFEGQVHGGLAQGAAQALLEGVTYDEDGNPTTANLADYTFVSAAELPSFETVRMETPTPVNELGAKGVGEAGTIGATPAVQNAVVDALAHLGVRHVDMPATPQRIWLALSGVGAAALSRVEAARD